MVFSKIGGVNLLEQRAPRKIGVKPIGLPSENKEFTYLLTYCMHASGPEFDLHVRHILSWRSTAILPLPLIQEEQLSVTGERMCTKYW